MAQKFTTVPSKRLASNLTSSGTTLKLNNITGWDGNDVVSGDFGDDLWAVLRNDSNDEIEIIKVDPSTIGDADGTGATILKRGLKFSGDLTTEVSGNKKTWIKNETIVELGSNPPQIFQWLKEYVDDTAFNGAPDSDTTVKGIVEQATASEIDNGAADGSGDTSAPLGLTTSEFANSKYDTQLPTSDEKDALGAADNPSSDNAFVTKSTTLTAGETINGATTPVAVYLDDSDDEIYACDANDTSKLKFLGFAVSDGTDGNDIEVQTSGIVGGFSSLSPGEKYYVQDDQTIGTSVGTHRVLVGIAVSATELFIFKGERLDSGTVSQANATNQTITTGFRPTVIEIDVVMGFGGDSDSTSSQAHIIWMEGKALVASSMSHWVDALNGDANATSTNNAQVREYSDTSPHPAYTFDITSVSDTGFTIDITASDSPSQTFHLTWSARGEL